MANEKLSNIDAARKVAASHQAINLSDDGVEVAEGSGVLLDATTAHLMVSVYDALKTEAMREKFNRLTLLQCVNVCWKLVNRGDAK